MKLSIYTFAKNAIFLDFHLVPMLKHHLPLADEIVINEGYSTDETYERIRDLDPKIKIFREEWGLGTKEQRSYATFKDHARARCTGDWCLLLDCDEFIPEWEFDPIREFLETTPATIVPLRYINFYGNYRVYHAKPEVVRWPAIKYPLHRNLPDIEVWGDGSNVRVRGNDDPALVSQRSFPCHHFGFVRHPARLRQKWRMQHNLLHVDRPKRDLLPSFVYDLRPHDWQDPDFLEHLAIYPGPFVKAVREDAQEFVRDGLELYHQLASGPGAGERAQ